MKFISSVASAFASARVMTSSFAVICACSALGSLNPNGPTPTGPGTGTPTGGVDPEYSFVYADAATGVAAYGVLDTVAGAGGAYTVTGGTLDITEEANVTLATPDVFTILPGSTDPVGAFLIDNVLYPGGNGSSSPYGGGPLISYYGLLFSDAAGNEINIWGNGATDTYSLWEWEPSAGYTLQNGNPGTGAFRIAPVPEPFTLCLSVGAIGLAVRRKLAARA